MKVSKAEENQYLFFWYLSVPPPAFISTFLLYSLARLARITVALTFLTLELTLILDSPPTSWFSAMNGPTWVFLVVEKGSSQLITRTVFDNVILLLSASFSLLFPFSRSLLPQLIYPSLTPLRRLGQLLCCSRNRIELTHDDALGMK